MMYYTKSDVAGMLGTCRSAIDYHIVAGHFPAPSHVKPGRSTVRLWYSEEDLGAIRRWWASRVPGGCSRFTDEDVAAMRSMWEQGLRQEEIASHFSTTQTNVSFLLTGRVLPGWRGGQTGKGRVRPARVVRRRNVGKTGA